MKLKDLVQIVSENLSNLVGADYGIEGYQIGRRKEVQGLFYKIGGLIDKMENVKIIHYNVVMIQAKDSTHILTLKLNKLSKWDETYSIDCELVEL